MLFLQPGDFSKGLKNELKEPSVFEPLKFYCSFILQLKNFCFCMDEWITFDFTSFLIVYQSYQNDGYVIMKGCMRMEPRLRLKNIPTSSVARIKDR